LFCRNTPYAFWHLPLSNLPDGYPVFFDINLSQVGLRHAWFITYLLQHILGAIRQQ
jgi:hypothetical protein